MRSRSLLIVRLALLLAFLGFVAGFAISQYEDVRSLVTVLCLSCIGIG
jgi:cell division protein FtsB